MVMKYKVTQTQKNHFLFEKPAAAPSEEVEIFLLKSRDDQEPLSLLTTNAQEFVVKLDLENERPYFIIRSEKGEYMLGERTLPVEGMNNFRDMGGYETVDGKTVKWGLLYRSDHIHNATDKGVEYLKKLHLQTIVDYRSDDEVEKYPNKVIDAQVKTYQLDPAAHAAELAAQFQSSKENEDINLINKIIEQQAAGTLVDQAEVVLEQYRTFANKEKSKTAFAEMLKLIADPDAPAVVQHCRGGKDRTGFGAMLILGTLGVKKEDLLADYLLTAENRKERNRIKMEGYRKLTSDPFVLDHLYSFIDTKPEFLEASIDTIIEKHRSIENYVISELGLSEAEIDTMKKLYLE